MTEGEKRAYREMAQAARKLLRAQRAAERKRQREAKPDADRGGHA